MIYKSFGPWKKILLVCCCFIASYIANIPNVHFFIKNFLGYFHIHFPNMEEKKFLRVGILNLTRLEKQCLIYQDLRKKINEEHEKSQEKILKMEESLHKSYTQLQKLETATPAKPDEILKIKETIEEKTSKIEQTIQKEKQILDEEIEKKSQKVREDIQKAIKIITQRYHLDMIFNTTLNDQSEIVVWAEQKFNITDELLNILNKNEKNFAKE
jgi:Skp family chaperone for outer membrane proteins